MGDEGRTRPLDSYRPARRLRCADSLHGWPACVRHLRLGSGGGAQLRWQAGVAQRNRESRLRCGARKQPDSVWRHGHSRLRSDGKDSFECLRAFDKATGETPAGEAKRPETSFAHSTPVIAQIGGQPQMLVSASGAIQGVDPAKGSVRWRCAAKGDSSSPAFGEGLVFSDSGRGGKAVCVDPTGAGDVTTTHLKWTYPQIPEGLSSGGHRRRLRLAHPQSGDIEVPQSRERQARLFRAAAERLDGGRARSQQSDGRIYFAKSA